jgi:arylsulfatase A-like enzyme
MGRPNQTYMVRTDRYKYIYNENNGVEEFYDMIEDPGEEMNLADRSDLLDIIAEHRETMINWAIENNDEELLEKGNLAVTKVDVADFEFNKRTLGWRWY